MIKREYTMIDGTGSNHRECLRESNISPGTGGLDINCLKIGNTIPFETIKVAIGIGSRIDLYNKPFSIPMPIPTPTPKD